MLRLQPFGYKRFMQAEAFEAVFGGGEANVAISLANFGLKSRFLTKLPKNPIADKCVKELRGWGVDTDFIVRGGERMGIYFCEKGYSQRPSNVVYDRAHSAVTEISAGEINIEKLFDGVNWFHFTGITPALGDTVTETLTAILQEAKKRNITVSCDLNYRKKLWTREKAKKVMTGLVSFVDVLISNEEDVKDIFGISPKGSSVTGGSLDIDGYKETGKLLTEMFPNLKYIAFTLRESISASRNGWSALLISKDGKAFHSKKYVIDIVDRVGGGDSFGAGLIYGFAQGFAEQESIEFAAAASCLKQTIEGDFNITSADEVLKLMGGDGSGRIQR